MKIEGFDDPARRAETGDLRALREALRSLGDPLERQIIILRFFLNLSLQQIAENLAIPYEEVRVRYEAALASLEYRIDRLGDPGSHESEARGSDSAPVLDERAETLAELYWDELHRSGEADRTSFLVQYPEHSEAMRVRLALVRLLYEERPAHRQGPDFPIHLDPSSEGFRRLLDRARDGDRSAMDEVLAIVIPAVREHARRYEDPRLGLGCDEHPLQAASEVARVIVSHFQGESDRETHESFVEWLASIVRSVGDASSRHRRRRRGGRPSPRPDARPGSPLPVPPHVADEGMTPDDGPAEPNPRAHRIRDELARLPDREEAGILWLHLFDGLTLAQIADRLGGDYRHVRQKYRSGARSLERRLDDLL